MYFEGIHNIINHLFLLQSTVRINVLSFVPRFGLIISGSILCSYLVGVKIRGGCPGFLVRELCVGLEATWGCHPSFIRLRGVIKFKITNLIFCMSCGFWSSVGFDEGFRVRRRPWVLEAGMWSWHSGLTKSTERIGTRLIKLHLVVREATSAFKSLSSLLEFLLLFNAPSSDFGKGPAQFRVTFFPWNKTSISGHHVIVFCHWLLGPHILVGSSIHVGITPSFSLFCRERVFITRSSTRWLKGMIEAQTSFSIVVKCQGRFVDLRSIPSYIRLFNLNHSFKILTKIK